MNLIRVRVLIIVAGLLSSSTPTTSQSMEPFSLKGFSLGHEMAQCPAETISEEARDGLTVCNLGPTTLANQSATSHAVIITDGKVAGVMVSLPGRGSSASSPIREALVEKFGQPTSSKPHLNEARWVRGSAVLSFDGYRGNVLLVDLSVNRRRAGDAAKANKKDL